MKDKLKTAVINNDIEAVRAMSVSDLDINTVFDYGVTALHLATLNDTLCELAELLMDMGADPEIRNETGATALISAARNNSVKIVTMLLKRGADPGAKDKFDFTAMDHALRHKYDKVIEVLKKVMEDRFGINNNG